MVMKRVRTYMIIFVVEIIGVLMFMGCSFKNPQKTSDATSALDLSINPYYDAGYDQGQEDGYHDGIENIRGDSYDDVCRYKGKKRKEYELGYEEGYDAGFDDGFADSDCDSGEEE